MKNTNKILKRLLLAAVILAMFFCFASCGGDEKTAEPAQTSVQESVQTASTPEPVQPAVAEPAPVQTPQQVETASMQSASAGTVVTASTEQPTAVVSDEPAAAAEAAETVTVTGSSYTVDIISAGLDVDYTGGQVIVVKFKFTNDGSTSGCFGDIVMVDVKQNGRTLSTDGIVISSDSFGGLAFNFRTPVSNGGSVTCAYAYPYSSSDDIDVSVRITTNDNARTTLGSGSATLSIG